MKRLWIYKQDQYIWGIYLIRGRLSYDLIFSYGRYCFKIILKIYDLTH